MRWENNNESIIFQQSYRVIENKLFNNLSHQHELFVLFFYYDSIERLFSACGIWKKISFTAHTLVTSTTKTKSS